jgi:YD repeat-containing protein
MMRLSSMTDGSNYLYGTAVNSATYNAANQLTALKYYDTSETRSYDNLMQLTNITATSQYYPSTSINVSYNYTAGSNNGKIGSATDAISGETVTYQYDSLNRLISASGSGWTQTQAYDPFGNLTGRTGTGTAQGTTISTPTNATTNQLSGYSYDANGNLIPATPMMWRIGSASPMRAGSSISTTRRTSASGRQAAPRPVTALRAAVGC